ncbi:right-handed parallel beta-helix repeat-containing protein [Paraglaciecola aquimarina]|uniref:Right-handed parallel beta-helix repeat-containing protein n=1 Tax=Paraglaciecola aquimarina TaxID=1235557 RepID=A0ABU3SW08_9ALTE|nr:right-handed parallel beta-helix repeat-containing protein [Paraglaciecola aquimarina]MDU0354209.1 right-handed parallel beta-helix repeat-containing protein [Paraglaciecola aquimarina]
MTWQPNLTFRDNIVRENRARGVLVTTKGKVIIENNYFNNQMHGILIEGDNKYWYESGAVEDVVIRNNKFVNVGFDNENRYPLYASPMLTKEQRIGEGHYHRNIDFSNNYIKSINGAIIHAKSVTGLTISNNVIEQSVDYPITETPKSIELIYTDKVNISGNKTIGFKRQLNVVDSENSTAISLKNNTGLVRK